MNGDDKGDSNQDDMDYGIMRALHDMMALEIDITPSSIDRSTSPTQLRWQRQYMEYSIKVKELLRKLLRKLENNYQYQRYLEDELKSFEVENPQITSEASVSNSVQLSTMIANVSRFFNTTSEFRKRPSIVSQNSPNEKTKDDSKIGVDCADDNDEILDIRNVGSIDFQDFEEIFKFTKIEGKSEQNGMSSMELIGSNELTISSLSKELEKVRKENYLLRSENSKMKDLRATELSLISKTMEAFSDRIRILNNHYGE